MARKGGNKSGDALAAAIRAIERSGHSVFAPSAAHRWMKCAGSLKASLIEKAGLIDEDGSPVTGSNIYSVTGTAAHAMAEIWLKTGRRPADWIGQEFTRDGITVVIDEEMLGYVEQYVDWCREREEVSHEWGYEEHVKFGDLFPLPDQGGTADHWCYNQPDRVLTITDLKYGTGVRVYAHENEQLMLYAYGVLLLLTSAKYRLPVPVKIVVRIAQPRLDHFDEWEFDSIRLMHFVHEVREKAREAWSDNPEMTPDVKACRFCPLRADCPALADEMEALADDLFDEDANENQRTRRVGKLSTEEMAKLLRWRPTMESWLKAIEQELFNRADGGEDVPGFKIAVGRRRRAWKKPHRLLDALDLIGIDPADAVTTKLKSPKQIEGLLRVRRLPKNAIASLVEVTDGLRALVPTLDPREGLEGVAAVFDEEDEDDLI